MRNFWSDLSEMVPALLAAVAFVIIVVSVGLVWWQSFVVSVLVTVVAFRWLYD